jgi:hypothetical protein
MTCKEIIKNYLTDNGFDGLCYEECGCSTGDFMPCRESYTDCVPAYAYEIKHGKVCKGCTCDCPFDDVSDYDYIYSPEDLPLKCRVKGVTG